MRGFSLLGLVLSGCVLSNVDLIDNPKNDATSGSGGQASGGSSGGKITHGGTASNTAGASDADTGGVLNEGGAGSSNAGSTAEGGTSAGNGGTTAGTGGAAAGGGGTAAGGGGTAAGGGGTAAGGGGTAGSGGAPALVAKNYQITGSWPTRAAAIATKAGALTYTKVEVHTRYLAASCTIGDYNNDGKPDVSSGRRWYEGPAFTTEHIYRDGHDDLPRAGDAAEIDTGISDDYSDYAFDVNNDGWADIINISNPDAPDAKNPTPQPAPQTHATAYWYQNPGPPAAAKWVAHLIHSDVRLESHTFGDVDGDGKPEISGACKSCTPTQTKGYYYANWADPAAAWSYRAVTTQYTFPFGGLGWLHGLGFGDINGDNKTDLLERGGAWIDVTHSTPNTTQCPGVNCGWAKTAFYDGVTTDNRGPAQIYAFDIDGDGDQDVISADWAHGYGLAWYEQTSSYTFTRRQFMGTGSAQDLATYGPVAFSEPHAMEVADMDGDGVPDMITGKMRFAHPLGQGDPDPQGAPLLYVFKTKRNTASAANGGTVTFEPHQIDAAVGVGTQIAVGHLNTDGILDLCVASKLGLYVFLGQ
jgi:FG-GAP-like repeat